MKTKLFKAEERGTKDIGWLKSKFSFSFSDYYEPDKIAFGTLVAFNDDLLEPGKGFGTHPHQNMEIISIILQGNMNHKDSMGYNTVVHEDFVQVMGAGSGLFHEEYNIGEVPVNFLQIWIQPKIQNTTPRYQQRHFPKAQRKNELVTVLSHEEGLRHAWLNQNASLHLGYFEAGKTVDYSFQAVNKCLFVFVISGQVSIGEMTLQARDAAGFWDTAQIELKCETEAEFLLIETVINQK